MRRVIFRLALVGFLCRALVPAGFMPAPLSEGGPIRLCHGGAAGALLELLDAARSADAEDPRSTGDAGASASHEHHAAADFGRDEHRVSHAAEIGDHGAGGDDHRATHEGWDRCPVGTAFAFAFVASDPPLVLPAPPGPLPVDDIAALVLRTLGGDYLARAPPRV